MFFFPLLLGRHVNLLNVRHSLPLLLSIIGRHLDDTSAEKEAHTRAQVVMLGRAGQQSFVMNFSEQIPDFRDLQGLGSIEVYGWFAFLSSGGVVIFEDSDGFITELFTV